MPRPGYFWNELLRNSSARNAPTTGGMGKKGGGLEGGVHFIFIHIIYFILFEETSLHLDIDVFLKAAKNNVYNVSQREREPESRLQTLSLM